LITRGPSGRFVLGDWKTGRMPNPEYFEDFRSQKAQLRVYGIWMRYKHSTENIKGTAVFLRDDLDWLSETFKPSVEHDVFEYMDSWRSQLNKMTSYTAMRNNLRRWCPWNELCNEAYL